jgi:hypothetical protein
MSENKINLNEIEKLPIDFEEIVELLKKRVKERLPNRWTDFLASNFGVELLEAFAYEAALMNYYLNMNVNECFLPTAKTKTSVYALARTIGYKPSPPSQATVTVKFMIEEAHNYPIYIPKYTKLLSVDGIPFYTNENKTIYPGELYVEVEAKSGTIITESIISNGIPRYRYKLQKSPVNKIETVLVNDEEYTQVDFIDTRGSVKQFTIDYDEEFNAYITFGDGNYGVNPDKNLLIDVTYIIGADKSHNVMPFTITEIFDLIYDSENNTITNIKVTNEQAAVGASDAESIDEVKRNVPSIYRTQHRCVTLQDYKDVALSIPSVKKAAVIDNSIMDEIGIFGVKVSILPEKGRYPNDAFRQYVKDYLEEKKIVATQIDIIDPVFITFDVEANISIMPNVSSSIVANKIRETIHDYLYWENRDFGENVSETEIYKRIMSVQGVKTINKLSVTEKRTMYVTETPTDGSTTIKYMDNLNIIKAGAKINILDINNELALSTTVVSVDNENNTLTIADPITADMNIGVGSLIYPTLQTAVDHSYGTKEIEFSVDSNIDLSKIDYTLMNLNNISIYFADAPTKYYRVLFKIGNKLYLDTPIDRDILACTEIVITSKKYVPTLAANVPEGSNVFYLNDYPRFGIGSKLTQSSMISFVADTIVMLRSGSSTKDYISSVMNDKYLVKVNKIYTSASNIFVEGVDYALEENTKVISWTATGRAKLPPNNKYYVDIIRKIVDTTDQNVEYYVKEIDKKKIIVTPAARKKLNELTTFEYTTEEYNLLPYEIADVGNINIVIV